MSRVEGILQILGERLCRTDADPRQIVVMTCGISGAGKSTLSKAILAAHPKFERISIDAAIHDKHGMYAVDYPAAKYSEYQAAASEECSERLLALLDDKNKDVVLDQSFYNKKDRDSIKHRIESRGARWVLVYLKAKKETLWKRIGERRVRARNADSAFEVTEEVLQGYIEGFEAPDGEGEIVFDQDSDK